MPDVAAFTARCPFCSLLCPIALERRGHELFVPGHVPESLGVRQGVCARGHLVCDLVAHGRRLNEAWVKGESGRTPVLPHAALADTASRLRHFDPDGIAVVVAGENCLGITAAHAFVQAIFEDAMFTVFVPAEDDACMDGLAASGVDLASQEEVAAADALLIVGDPFATRPVLGRAVHAAKMATDRMPMVVLDSVPGTTGKFASSNVIVPPGAEANWLAALLQHLVPDDAKLSVDRSVVEGLAKEVGGQADEAAEALAKAERLVVIVAPEFGRSSGWDAIALLAGEIAEAKAGKAFAALSAANALGAYRMARHLASARLADLYERIEGGQIKALVCIGADIATSWPRLDDALRNIPFLMAASAMPSRTTELAHIEVPLAFPFEEPLVALGADAVRVEAPGGTPAPLGALGAVELFQELGEQLGKTLPEVEIDDALLAPSQALSAEQIMTAFAPPPAVEAGQLVLVGEATALHAGDGSLSRWTRWSTAAAPEPTIRLSRRDAQALEVRAGSSLVWQGCSFRVELSAEMPSSVAEVSSQFADARKLFECKADGKAGRLAVGPTAVPITAFSGLSV